MLWLLKEWHDSVDKFWIGEEKLHYVFIDNHGILMI